MLRRLESAVIDKMHSRLVFVYEKLLRSIGLQALLGMNHGGKSVLLFSLQHTSQPLQLSSPCASAIWNPRSVRTRHNGSQARDFPSKCPRTSQLLPSQNRPVALNNPYLVRVKTGSSPNLFFACVIAVASHRLDSSCSRCTCLIRASPSLVQAHHLRYLSVPFCPFVIFVQSAAPLCHPNEFYSSTRTSCPQFLLAFICESVCSSRAHVSSRPCRLFVFLLAVQALL
jgi:hypothetical protein